MNIKKWIIRYLFGPPSSEIVHITPPVELATTFAIVPHPTSRVTHVRNVPEDTPRWKRTYSCEIAERRCMMILEAYTFIGRNWGGQLTQNGKYVLFDPRAVADKILDPILVPIIEDACAEIMRIDDAFIASDRKEFTDEAGQRWRRITE